MKRHVRARKIFCIAGGNGLIAFAVCTFILRNGISSGGVSGIGIICSHICGLPVSTWVFAVNVVLFLLGLKYLGKKFAAATLISTVVFPMWLKLFEEAGLASLDAGVSGSGMALSAVISAVVSAVAAGFLTGLGISMVIKAGASTGGIDIIALILYKTRGFAVSSVQLCVDGIILLSQFFFYNGMSVFYGILASVVTSCVIRFAADTVQSRGGIAKRSTVSVFKKLS